MGRSLGGVIVLVLLIVAASSVGPRLAAVHDGSDELDPSAPSAAHAELPALTVHYFRSQGELSEARFAVDFSAGTDVGEAWPDARRFVARIRRLDSSGRARLGADVVIEPGHWIASRVAPLLYRSRTLLRPGRHWLELSIEYAGRFATIDRILDVPSFPRDELTVSSIIAVSETVPSEMGGRVDSGRELLLYTEAYPPICPEGRPWVFIELQLRRAGKIVREQRYRTPCTDGRAQLVERLETDVLEPGPYVLRARASLPSMGGEVAVSPGLELTIEDPAARDAPTEITTFRNNDEML